MDLFLWLLFLQHPHPLLKFISNEWNMIACSHVFENDSNIYLHVFHSFFFVLFVPSTKPLSSSLFFAKDLCFVFLILDIRLIVIVRWTYKRPIYYRTMKWKIMDLQEELRKYSCLLRVVIEPPRGLTIDGVPSVIVLKPMD